MHREAHGKSLRSVWRRLPHVWGLVLVLLFSFVACGKEVTSVDSSFRQTINAEFDPQIQLQTNKKRYSAIDRVDYQVRNTSQAPLYFADQSMGILGYQYDQEASKWELIDLGFSVGDPKSTVVFPANQKRPIPYYSFSVSGISGNDTIRLVVFGRVDDPRVGKKVAAYTDITIDKDNPEFVGEWEGSGILSKALPDGENNFLRFSFDSTHLIIRFSSGPEFGAAEVVIDGRTEGLFCNFAQSYSQNQIEIDVPTTGMHELLIYPHADKDCSREPGYTNVLDLVAL